MTSTITKQTALKVAKDFLKFVDASPSPYHAVEACKERLLAAGFKQIHEKEHWDIKPNDKCFVTRNQSTIIAFAVGEKFVPGNGFTMLGAHTDSPCLRVKVQSTRQKEGYLEVGTECYGGGNWGTWFDRDLRIAGRLIVSDGGKLCSKLVHVNKPIMRVPHLAIHLQRGMNENFSINKEKHLVPVLATSIDKQLNKSSGCAGKHPTVLIELLAKEAGCEPESIIDVDLFLADHQPSAIGGIEDDFIFAPRLDNLLSSYCGLEALIQSCNCGDSLAEERNIRMLALFDNEEVGSSSAMGAGSALTEYVMRRLCVTESNCCAFEESIPKSMMVSADMAHAIHPNYPDVHEMNLRPNLTDGPVIKINNNQRYATTATTAAIIRECARCCGVPIQDVMVRNDMGCGSTIGPILSTRLGIKTMDIGGAQLSMHSIREVCGVLCPEQCVKLYEEYFKKFHVIDSQLTDTD